jgi:hypothetical protein
MKINKIELLKLYNEEVESICEACDWVTHFTAENCVDTLCRILEKNPQLIKYEHN